MSQVKGSAEKATQFAQFAQLGQDEEHNEHLLDSKSFALDTTYIHNGYQSQETADDQFQKDLANELSAFLLQYNAWATARPEAELERNTERMNTMYSEITRREQEQGAVQFTMLCLPAHRSLNAATLENMRLQYADMLQKVRALVLMCF
ncbi:hypothetical protein M408DRAFT_27147 [Serendipita vermifera MAFF 305830]|uniref:Uncharacterized protein n=1 Tax=Serendipita vermifera MAFF 305830 TaxID=933852 RepID=A0A0C3AYI3_SERVB|nr:hypothetical protein M408DRAFT_27147 [Serendipita vermifera MAFF 305830]